MNNNIKDQRNQRTSLCSYCNQKATQTHYCISSSARQLTPASHNTSSQHSYQASSLQEAFSLSKDPEINPVTELVEIPKVIKPWIHLRNHMIGKGAPQSHRIGVVAPQLYDVVEKVQASFIEQLAYRGLPMVVELYHGYGDRVFLNEHLLPHLSNQPFKVLYTIGLESTRTAMQIFSGRKNKVVSSRNLLFSSIKDLSMANIDPFNHEYVTGVRASRVSGPLVEALMALMPDMKRIVIVYCPDECGGITAEIKNEMQLLFGWRGILVDCITVNKAEGIARAVEPVLVGADLLLTLRDNTVTPAIPELAELSRKWRVPLCGSNLNVVERGAAFGFGCDEEETGRMVAEQAHAFLNEGIPMQEIPFYTIRGAPFMRINPYEAALQGFQIDATRLRALKNFLML